MDLNFGARNPFHSFQSPLQHAHVHAVDMRATKRRRLGRLAMAGPCTGEIQQRHHNSQLRMSHDKLGVNSPESHPVSHCTFLTTQKNSIRCNHPGPAIIPRGYASSSIQDRGSPTVMPSFQGFNAPQPTSTDYRLHVPPSKSHESKYFAMEQTNTPIVMNSYPNVTNASSISFKIFPHTQELPALVPDVGGSSDSSLFEPTPVPTPQDEVDTCSLAGDDKETAVENDLGDLITLDGVWDPNQSLSKYRTLAPKPPTPRPEQLHVNGVQQRYPFTQAGPRGRMAPTGNEAVLPLRLARFSSQALSQSAPSSVNGQELLFQQPASPATGALFGPEYSPQIFHGQAVANSTQFLGQEVVLEPSQYHHFTRLHGSENRLANDGCQTHLPLPTGPSSGVGSDFDALFETSAFDHPQVTADERPYLDSNVPAQSPTVTRHRKLDTIMESQWKQDSDPFWTHPDPKTLSNDNASGNAQLPVNNSHQGNAEDSWSMQSPIASLTLPRADGLNQPSYHMPALEGSLNSAVSTLATPRDALSEDDVLQQQYWRLNQNGVMRSTLYRNSYEAAYPPFEEEPGNRSSDFGPSSNPPDDYDFSSSPLYYPNSNARNPSLPTTPIRTDERGHRDTSRDQLLRDAKDSGMSYKEIKETYGFQEAESTLRGRYRTLTKPKDQRVRKPTWDTKAINALIAAVHSFAQINQVTDNFVWVDGRAFLEDGDDLKKISWKKVADLVQMDGCYLYGNSTTKSKYTELRKKSLARLGL